VSEVTRLGRQAAPSAGAGRPAAPAASGPLALFLAGLTVALIAVAAVLTYLTRDFQVSFEGVGAVHPLVFAALGLVIARHQPRNPIGWLLIGCGALTLAVANAELYAVLDYRTYHGALPLGREAVLAETAAFLVAVLYGLAILLFPDGTLPSRRWRWVLWAYLIACALFMMYQFIDQSTVLTVSRLRVDLTGSPLNNPDPGGAAARVAHVGQQAGGVIGVCWLAFVGRQVAGYRRAAGERRQQLKWLMAGGAVCLVAVIVTLVAGNYSSPAAHALQAASTIGVAALPVGIAVGILKYRLYDIDRIISRTLSYAIVTGLLVGVYAGLVLLATRVLPFSAPVAVAASTLAAAALFSPLRRRVQRAVDRRFNRARYDADQTVAAFAGRLQDAVDLDMIRADLAGVVYQALEPASVSVWLNQPS